jgi:hypothetical protein
MAIFEKIKLIIKTLLEAGKTKEYQQILEMQKKIQSLEKKYTECKEKLEIKENLVYENNAYWIDKEGKKDGPFCSRCWDVDKNLVRLRSYGNQGYYMCSHCKDDAILVKPWSGRPQSTRITFERDSYL